MKVLKVKGSASQILEIFIQDTSSTTGAGLTGLAFNTASLTCYYHRNTAAAGVAVSLVTMTVGTFTSSGFKEVDATNLPGVYQLCLPDAAYVTGADAFVALLKGAANMQPVVLEVQLTGVDHSDAVRFGMTALPNAAAEAAGGLYTRGTGAGQINQPANGLVDVNTLRWNGTAVAAPATAGIPDVNVKNMNNVAATSITAVNANVGTTQPVSFTGTGASALAKSDAIDLAGQAITAAAGVTFPSSVASPTNITAGTITTATNLTTNNDKTGYGLSAGAIQAIWDALTSTLTTVGSVGKAIADNLTGNAFTRLGAPVGASISADIAGVQADTDNIQTRIPAALVSGRIDASVGAMATDVLTSGAVAASAVTELQTGLSTLDAAGVRTAVGLASANLDTQLMTIDDFLDTEIAAIKAKTDNLPAAPAAVGDIPTAVQNADALLNRDMSAVTVTNARSPINALRWLRNKWSVSGSTLTVTKEDDTTTAWTAALTTNASADPVTASDPT